MVPHGKVEELLQEASGFLLQSAEDDPNPSSDDLRRAGELLDAEVAGLGSTEGAELRHRREYAWLELARRFDEDGDQTSALAAWRHLREVGSDSQPAWIQPVQILLDQGKVGEAKAIAREAEVALPASAIVEFLNGRVADAEDNPDAAARAYAGALKRWPASLGALVGLANCRIAQKDWAAAEQALRRAVDAAPGSGDAANNLARLEVKAGNLDIYMVSELSTSGGIFPRAYLKEKGLELGRDDIVFTGSHSNCLDRDFDLFLFPSN